MLDILKIRKKHGKQFIKDLAAAKVFETYKGFPVISPSVSEREINQLNKLCPTNAISEKSLSIDLGKCIFCGECGNSKLVNFTSEHRLSTTDREKLVVTHTDTAESYLATAIQSRKEIKKLFGRSLKLRQVSAGGCNGCESELNAVGNVNFDIGRFGIDFVASPRHADGIVITGPITDNMSAALYDAYKSIPYPKIVIAVGTCAISGGLFQESEDVIRKFADEIKIDLYVPGCPPHPLTFISGILNYLSK